MNQRDRAFLQDMNTFICMNRLATVFALARTAAEPELTEVITKSTMKYLRFYDGGNVNAPEPLLNELVQHNRGNIQSIMAAKLFAELFASYEDLGTFGSAIKYRASKGIFSRYITSMTKEAAFFLQEIIDSNIPEHPELTLDTLLRLPSVAQLDEYLPPEVLSDLESYYHAIPKYLYDIAKHYRMQRRDAQSVNVGNISPAQWQPKLAIVLGFVPESEDVREGRLTVDVFNRIKHQFLVTGNLAAYIDTEDTRSIEYAEFSLEQDFIDGVIQGVISIARVMSDFASILLLLDKQGVKL